MGYCRSDHNDDSHINTSHSKSICFSTYLWTESIRRTTVILVPGYAEDAAVWKKWEDMLRKDGIRFFTVTFEDSDDKCGSAKQHAIELERMVQNVKEQSGSQKINIVGHSKGGLDARISLDITDTKDIANLIMMEHQMQVL
jgi:triacylglycerol esterase/lipase EstA (alpha/beta hydrolase family)